MSSNAPRPNSWTSTLGKPPSVYDKSVMGLDLDDKLTIQRRANMIAFAHLEEIPFNSLNPKKNSFAAKFYWQKPLRPRSQVHPDVVSALVEQCHHRADDHAQDTGAPGHTVTQARDPDFFFTASISGCSVFVHGDPKAPTVSHAGTTDPRATKAFEVTPVFKDGLDTGKKLVTPNGNYFPNGNVRNHWNAVHQRHFGNNTNASSIHTSDYKNYLGTENTPQALEYDKFLRDASGREIQIDEVQSSGCVFGLRDPAGEWSFHLQKNIEVKVTKLKKKKHLLHKNTYVPNVVPSGRTVIKNYGDGPVQEVEMIEQQIQMSIPIHVMKFFPGQRSAEAGTAMLDKDTVRAIVLRGVG